MRIVSTSLILLLSSVLSACNSEQDHTVSRVITVSYMPIQESVSSQYREFIGQVMPAELTPIAFRINGELDKVAVKSGQKVKQGQILARLDNRKLQQQLQDATAQRDLAEKQFQRASTLLEQKLLSPAEYDELRAKRKLSEIQFKVAQTQLSYSVLHAPFSGTVTYVNKDNYENIAAGEMVLQMHQQQWLDVKIQLPHQIAAYFDSAKGESDYQPEVYFSNQQTMYLTTLLEHTLQPAPDSEAFEARYRMPQPLEPILPGTPATIKLDLVKAGLSDQQGFSLPITAIDSNIEKDEFKVWKIIDNTAQATPVRIAQLTPQGALISVGVNLGDKIITSHHNQLRNGMSVQAVQEQEH